jgi:hypothetical protein
MAATASVTIIHSFSYRGVAGEEWECTYHFTGADPANDAEWKTIADAIIALEKTCYTSLVSVVRAIGHNAGQAVHAWAYDYAAHSESVAGTLTAGTSNTSPGDCAVWLRWPTTQLTSAGKPIYLRNYFHDARRATGTVDQVFSSQSTALVAFGEAMLDFLGDASRGRAGPNGAVAQTGAAASAYTTTRTLKRRGRRPLPA